MTFQKHNYNPSGLVTSDCVIRAIVGATNERWLEVFDRLTKIARTKYTIVNAKECYSEYLSEVYKTIPVKYDTPKGKKRYTVKDICKWNGIYIVRVANHLTVVKHGVCYDTYDCTERSAYIIWRVSQ